MGALCPQEAQAYHLSCQESARYLRRDEKFGITVPKSVKEVYELDKADGNTIRAYAVAKERLTVKVAFQILDDGEFAPRDHQSNKCRMVFDVKM